MLSVIHIERGLAIFFCAVCFHVHAQSLQKGDVLVTANIGAPHLFKSVVKAAAKKDRVKQLFEGKVEVGEISGLNPVMFKAEYAFNKFFALGLSGGYWDIRFNIRDVYNVQNQNQYGVLVDSVDIYSLQVSSTSYGIRPNLYIPVNSRGNQFYLGLGLGLTKNKLTIGFSSTDAGRVAKIINKDLEYAFSLPGGIYFAPTIGYRHFFGEYVGMNMELGYEKGAIVQGGIAFRIPTSKESAQN